MYGNKFYVVGVELKTGNVKYLKVDNGEVFLYNLAAADTFDNRKDAEKWFRKNRDLLSESLVGFNVDHVRIYRFDPVYLGGLPLKKIEKPCVLSITVITPEGFVNAKKPVIKSYSDAVKLAKQEIMDTCGIDEEDITEVSGGEENLHTLFASTESTVICTIGTAD